VPTRVVVSAMAVLAAGLGPSGPANAAPSAHAADVSPGISRGIDRAGGAVTLGQVAATGAQDCNPGPIGIAQYLEGGPPSFLTPTAGVITSYSVQANAAAGTVRLVLFGPSPTAGHRTVVGLSAQNPVVVNTLNTFATRIPVAAGLSIGLNNSASGMICWGAGVAGDEIGLVSGFDPGASSDFAPAATVASVRANISAVLEPDVDGDLYGDVSQDLCPQLKVTQAACPPPDVTVTKAPKKKSSKRKATVKFTSTVPGATYTCAVDGKAAKPCASPYKKKFKYGKHTVLITATSQFGIVDPTPAKVKFKVVRPS
jgi:hypothetical protein